VFNSFSDRWIFTDMVYALPFLLDFMWFLRIKIFYIILYRFLRCRKNIFLIRISSNKTNFLFRNSSVIVPISNPGTIAPLTLWILNNVGRPVLIPKHTAASKNNRASSVATRTALSCCYPFNMYVCTDNKQRLSDRPYNSHAWVFVYYGRRLCVLERLERRRPDKLALIKDDRTTASSRSSRRAVQGTQVIKAIGKMYTVNAVYSRQFRRVVLVEAPAVIGTNWRAANAYRRGLERYRSISWSCKWTRGWRWVETVSMTTGAGGPQCETSAIIRCGDHKQAPFYLI